MTTYEYNIYRNKHLSLLDRMLLECCFVWNHALELQNRYYGIYGKHISYPRMCKHFAKRINKKLNLLHSWTIQEVLGRQEDAFRRFFNKLAKRPPKFKKPENFCSLVFKGNPKTGGYILNGNTLFIRKHKQLFKFSFSRNYEGNVKQVRIKRYKTGKYSLYITTDHSVSNMRRKTHNGASVGLDFGLKTYLTGSDGTKIESPRFFKQSEKEIKRLNRRVSKAKKCSNNRKKRKLELSKAYEKISNQRRDWQYKLAHQLCQNYDYIFLEDLILNGMKSLWGKKVSDLAHSNFVSILKHVATKYGVTVHEIDRWYPSSKTCRCGYVYKELSLRERSWICPKCGSRNDRDLNAAKNILRRGIYELESQSKTSRQKEASNVCI